MEQLSSVRRALQLLQLLRECEGLTLTGAAQALGVSVATAHRLFATLEEAGFAAREADSRRYRLGPAMLHAGTTGTLAHTVAVARAPMQRLQRATGETVHLSVLRGNRCLFASSIESGKLLRVTTRVGSDPYAHATAGGKVLLAELPRDVLRTIYPQEALPTVTARTITSREQLLAELSLVRERGWARNVGESEEGMYTLAVPVARPGLAPLASLTVALPLSRILPADGDALSATEAQLLELLTAHATEVSERLVL